MSKTFTETKEAIPETALAQHEARSLAHQAIARRGLVKTVKADKLSGSPARVEWGSVGSVTPEFAEAMAEALMAAAKAARELNIPKRAYMDMDNPEGYYGR